MQDLKIHATLIINPGEFKVRVQQTLWGFILFSCALRTTALNLLPKMKATGPFKRPLSRVFINVA